MSKLPWIAGIAGVLGLVGVALQQRRSGSAVRILTLRATLAERVAEAKREILVDVASGRVPRDTKDFSELHDYVDANEYGGWFREDDKAWRYRNAADIAMANDVSQVIDDWIRAGEMKRQAAKG